MQHSHSLAEFSLSPGKSWLTIGVFDGVHRGHQAILKSLTEGAQAHGATSVVLTFHPHPVSVLTGQDIKMLTAPDERAELFGRYGVDAVITEPFTRALSAVSAYDFMARLTGRLGLQRLLIGYDFALGKGREGDATRLAEIGRELNYEVQVIEAVQDGSEVISSSAIRKLVAAGSVDEAAELLGHLYAVSGAVIHGDGRGRQIGFPTANLDYSNEKVLPANGIYAAWAWLGDARHVAAVNVGVRPTVKPDQVVPTVEAYLLDFDRDIYDQNLKLEFVRRLRDELKFPSLQAMIEQIHVDVMETGKLLTTLRDA